MMVIVVMEILSSNLNQASITSLFVQGWLVVLMMIINYKPFIH